jgi:hypothetical protein
MKVSRMDEFLSHQTSLPGNIAEYFVDSSVKNSYRTSLVVVASQTAVIAGGADSSAR